MERSEVNDNSIKIPYDPLIHPSDPFPIYYHRLGPASIREVFKRQGSAAGLPPLSRFRLRGERSRVIRFNRDSLVDKLPWVHILREIRLSFCI